jgi:hypothetical protein
MALKELIPADGQRACCAPSYLRKFVYHFSLSRSTHV